MKLNDLVHVLDGDAVVADMQTRQCPDGEKYIRGRTGDGLGVLALTCTWEWPQQELEHRSCRIST